ncbi:hypothetical protein [Tepidibacter sp. Z1-5]|uniref:hypothetical protein n=1 Tax=Tepidibacter sp. Z1-5 TaxID=3134138 RepID=UPI0030C3F8C7
MNEDIKDLLETIADMSAYTECDLVFVEAIANKYGFTINRDLEIEDKEITN